jgi:signal transduction histidine kinase
LKNLSDDFINNITDEQLIEIISERISKKESEHTKLKNYLSKLNFMHLEEKSKNELLDELADLSSRLAHLEEHRSRFLSIVRNIFNNPLFGMLTIIDSTQNELSTNQTLKSNGEFLFLKENIEMLNNELLYLNFQINNIVSAAEIEDSQLELNISSFSLNKKIDEIVSSLKFSLQDGLITIVKKMEDNIWVAQDDEKISLILSNLVANAISLNQGNEPVLINVEKSEESVTIEIKNNGVYDLKENEIFAAYKQLNEGYDRESQGLGIGLTIVKSLSDFLGAEVNFYSEDNTQTVFSVKFPNLKDINDSKDNDEFDLFFDEDFDFDFNDKQNNNILF